MENNTSSNPPNTAIVVSMRGSVVDVRFDGGLPPMADAQKVKRQEALRNAAADFIQALRQKAQTEVFAVAQQTSSDLATTGLEQRVAEDRETIIEQARTALASFQPKPATTADSES